MRPGVFGEVKFLANERQRATLNEVKAGIYNSVHKKITGPHEAL